MFHSLLSIAALLVAALSFAMVNMATAAVWLMLGAILLALLARRAQAEQHHRERLKMN